MATYKKYATKDGTPIQVQSAVEDGAGNNIEDDYAKQNGYYQELTSGLSENLASRMRLSDNGPYLFRTTGGALEVGNQCLENKIVGGSIVVNQMLPIVNSDTTENGIRIVLNSSDNTITIDGEYTGSDVYPIYTILQTTNYIINTNDKYFRRLKYVSGSAENFVRLFIGNGGNFISISRDGDLFNYDVADIYHYSVQNNKTYVGFSPTYGGLVSGKFNSLKFKLELINLTQMFGNQIANYIYSLEQANAGAGVAWVKQFLPKDYYEYTATPYFLNVKTTGKKVVGFNAYNNTTGTAKLLGGNQYQITGTYTSVSYLDDLGNTETLTINTDGKFTPTNSGVLTVVDGNATDTCVHLVWDGERDGEFEAYREITYPTSDVGLRGIPKLDSDNNLYYDGDKYKSDGTVERKYAVDTLLSNYAVGDTITISAIQPNTQNIKCNKYGDLSEWGTISGTVITLTKALSSDDVILYELATPTTETADAFTQRQWIDNWGTEEWIDNRTIPLLVGHNTEYLPNLKAKVEVSPESPETDGYYVLKREDGINTYYDLSSYLVDNKYAKLDGELPYNLFKEIHSNVVLILNITSNNQIVNFNQTAVFQSINWGDGIVNNQITHTYSAKGIYIVSIKGTNILNAYRATFALSNPAPIVKIYIGDTEISIGSESLRGYQGEEIFIPRNIDTIKGNAFQNASNLKRIIFESYTPCTIQSAAFDNNNALLYVPLESIDAYKTAWSTYASRIRALVDDKYVADNYAKKEEIATTNLGTITTATIVSNSFYRNNIAVSGGISVGDIVFVQMSNGAVYPTINNNATQLVIFNGSDLSSLTITNAWKR